MTVERSTTRGRTSWTVVLGMGIGAEESRTRIVRMVDRGLFGEGFLRGPSMCHREIRIAYCFCNVGTLCIREGMVVDALWQTQRKRFHPCCFAQPMHCGVVLIRDDECGHGCLEGRF